MDFLAALPEEEEARALALATGEQGDELRFECAAFTVDGSLAGVPFSLPLSAQGIATFRATELQLAATPPVDALPNTIRLPFCEVDPHSLRLNFPLFCAPHVAGTVRSGSFRIDVLAIGATHALFAALRRAVVNAASIPPPLPRLVRTGRHFALFDPQAPATLILTEQLVPARGEPPSSAD